jgi:hypothetical protein
LIGLRRLPQDDRAASHVALSRPKPATALLFSRRWNAMNANFAFLAGHASANGSSGADAFNGSVLSGLPTADQSTQPFATGGETLRCCKHDTRSVTPRTSRRRLWEILPMHHCVLLGAAFDARELCRIFRRAGYVDWEGVDEYGLHSSAVHCVQERNDFSRLAHKILEERYRGAVARFKSAGSPAELIGLWRQHAARGDPMPAYWAALTHPACDPGVDEVLSQEMHMLSHHAFATRRAAMRRLFVLEAGAHEREQARNRANEQCAALRRETARLREELAAAKRETFDARDTAARLQATVDRWERGEQAGTLAARIRALTGERDAARHDADAARRALKRAMRRIEWYRQTRGAISPADRHGGPAPAPEHYADELPGSPDLSQRQILCVGGRVNLVPRYREQVQAANAIFSYHDGGIEDHMQRLPAMLAAADGVVCLAGDVSHGAYHLVKRYCKRTGKPCTLVGNSGISALSRCLVDIAQAGGRRRVSSAV